MTSIDKDKYIYYFRVILCVVGWLSLILTLIDTGIYLANNGGDVILTFSNLFSYWTIQTNLMVIIWLTIAIIYTNRENKPKILGSIPRGAITIHITVTFLVFSILLAPSSVPQGISFFTNAIEHYILPVAFIFDWVITETENKYEWRYDVYWLTYPILYLIYTLIRGAVTVPPFYPYFFLDLTVLSVTAFVVSVIVLIIFFLLLGAIYIFVNRVLYKRKNA